jgi:hypothetical protein
VAVGETTVGAAALLLFVLVGGSATTTTVGRGLLAVGGETGAGIGNDAVMGAPTDAADADADVLVLSLLLLRNDKVTGTAMAANTTIRAIAAITAYIVVHLVVLRGTAAFDEGVDNGVEGSGTGDDPFSLFDDNKVKSSASSSLLG